VRTTKAYSTKLAVTVLLALYLADCRSAIDNREYERILSDLQAVPEKLGKILKDKSISIPRHTSITATKTLFYRAEHRLRAVLGGLSEAERNIIYTFRGYAAGSSSMVLFPWSLRVRSS
jgi:hypothetical protein